MAKDSYVMTRKIQVIPVGDKEDIDRAYKYIRDARYVQNRAYNLLISTVYAAIISRKSNEEINTIYKRGSRKPKENDPEYSLYDYDTYHFPVGLPIASGLSQRVKSDIKKAKQNGLFKGNSSLPNKRRTSALELHPDYVRVMAENKRPNGLYHKYDSDDEFYEALRTGAPEIYWKFCNGIEFKMVIRNPRKDACIRSELEKIFKGEYAINGSHMNISDSDNKIILFLTFTVPKSDRQLLEDVTVGVDVGMAIPAVCALNSNPGPRLFTGTYIVDGNTHKGTSELLRQRTSIQNQLRRHQSGLKYSSGGHGRAKKLRSLEKLKDRERNFVNTYNHRISKAVVDFALKHKAKYINIEELKGYDANDLILRNWSYYELQNMITYKAERYGITVRKIEPAYTSQTCSCCGNVSKAQRRSQSEFVCINPDCENYMKVVNADYNAARNIAMSTKYVK